MLGSTSSELLAVTPYQFDRARRLLPAPTELYGPGPKPLRLNIRDKKGQLLAVLQYFPWQDGAVVRKFGPLPLAGLLRLVQHDPRVLVMHDPEQPGMEVTTIMDVSEANFRRWPKQFNNRSNIRAKIVEPGDPDYDKVD
jgi:hypothetical protein